MLTCAHVFVSVCVHIRICARLCIHMCVCVCARVRVHEHCVCVHVLQTCLLLHFGRKVYALKALFTLELPDFTLLGHSLRLWVNYDRFV